MNKTIKSDMIHTINAPKSEEMHDKHTCMYLSIYKPTINNQ